MVGRPLVKPLARTPGADRYINIMVNRKPVNWAAGVVILACAAWLYVFLYPTPPNIDPRPHQGIGEVMADEALKLLEPGARLIVVARNQDSFVLPAARVQLDSFLKAIRAAGKAPHAIRSINVDPLRAVSVPPGEFAEILRQGKENDVIVSFLGPPTLAPQPNPKAGPVRSRIVALCSGAMPARINLKKAFDLKLLHSAIVSRADAPATASPGNARAAFDQMYRVLTPDNLGDLTAPNVTAAAH